MKAAEEQANMNRNFKGEEFKWTGTFVKLVTPKRLKGSTVKLEPGSSKNSV
jgi:hypothetical protein